MADNEVLRVTLTWSAHRSQVLRVFVNGRSIEGLSLWSAEVLERYMSRLRQQGWRFLGKELARPDSETYWFQRECKP